MKNQGWQKTKTTDIVGFEVISVKDAAKAGYVVTTVSYPTSPKLYTYVRKATTHADGTAVTVVDGCEVQFNIATKEVVSVTRSYDTAGLRKQNNPGGAGKAGQSKAVEKAVEKEPVEIEPVEIEVEDTVEESEVVEAVEIPEQPVEQDGVVHHNQYGTIKACIENNIPVYLSGPAGSGKNHTVEQIADQLGYQFFFSNSIQQEYKLTGFIDAGGKYHETEFYKACTAGQMAIFFLDEIDASIPEVLVLLNAAIANGYFEFPNGRINLGNVRFVAAGNTVGNGADDMYTGRTVLDQATLDRFAIIEFDYDIAIERLLSGGNEQLIQFIHQLRSDASSKGIRATFSYRCITMVVKLEKAGIALDKIIKIAVVKGLDADTISTLHPIGVSKYHKALENVQVAA